MGDVIEEIPLDSEGVPAAPEAEIPVTEPVTGPTYDEPAPEPKRRGRPKAAVRRDAPPPPPKKAVRVAEPKKRGRPPRPPPPTQEDSEDEPPYTSPGMDTLAVAADVLRLLSAQKATRLERQREQYRSWIL